MAADNACVLVHCGGGKGRAGTFAACCLAMWGAAPPPDLTAERPVLSAQEAVRIVRSLRPGSIETQEQEAFVQASCSSALLRTQTTLLHMLIVLRDWLCLVVLWFHAVHVAT